MKMKFTEHVNKWIKCERCYLHETRRRVVLCRGKLPCDALFIGEAPGESEDVLGIPFCGPAGKLLDYIIEESIGNLRFAITNLLACIPKDEFGKLEEPPYECVKACSPRVQEFYDIAKPKLIVAVGSVARDWLEIAISKAVKELS